MKNATVIEFEADRTIESALKELRSYKGNVSGSFSGLIIYPHDSIDEAYKKVTGKTKKELDDEVMSICIYATK